MELLFAWFVDLVDWSSKIVNKDLVDMLKIFS